MSTVEVNFHQKVPDELVEFVVIGCRYRNKWLWVKHKERSTYEMPGGHREIGETINEAAKRELQEETGAAKYSIEPITYYSVTGKTRVSLEGNERYGRLYYAELEEIREINSEIEKFDLFDLLPYNLTYPEIQPHFINFIIN